MLLTKYCRFTTEGNQKELRHPVTRNEQGKFEHIHVLLPESEKSDKVIILLTGTESSTDVEGKVSYREVLTRWPHTRRRSVGFLKM